MKWFEVMSMLKWKVALLVSSVAYLGIASTKAIAAYPQISDCGVIWGAMESRPFPALQTDFKKAIESPLVKERNRLDGLLDRLLFEDYANNGSKMMQLAQGHGRLKNSSSVNTPEFKDFMEARSYLNSDRGPWDLNRVIEAHSIVNRSANPKAAGKIRNEVGLGSEEIQIKSSQIHDFLKDPYLQFVETGRIGNDVRGGLVHPDADNLKPQALEIVRSRDAGLAERIEKFQTSEDKQPAERAELTQGLVRALVESRVDRMEHDLKAIEPVNSAKKLEKFLDLAGNFTKDLVAIHPFEKDNEQFAKALLVSLFERAKLAPPRLRDVKEALNAPTEDWIAQIREGMMSSHGLYKDVVDRIEMGLNPSHSPELATPAIPRSAPITIRYQGKPIRIEDYTRSPLEARQFVAYVANRFRYEPFLQTKFNLDPKGMSKTFHDDFHAWAKSNQIDYEPEKTGRNTSRSQLHFIDSDFIDTFGEVWAHDKSRWQKKMDTWYQPRLVWRGLPYLKRSVEEPEIVDMFRKVHPQMASNLMLGIGRKVGPMILSTGLGQAAYKAMARFEMNRYNKSLLNDKIDYAAKNQSESDRWQYPLTFSYSTSPDQRVSKAFARGAMVVGDYKKGGYDSAENQAKIHTRLNVAVRQANKDVDLNLLHAMHPSFIYKFPRQQEVTGMAAADPDSVMVVQSLNARGEVDQSYVRNPNEPDTVWVVRGNYKPMEGEEPPADRLIKKIKL